MIYKAIRLHSHDIETATIYFDNQSLKSSHIFLSTTDKHSLEAGKLTNWTFLALDSLSFDLFVSFNYVTLAVNNAEREHLF